MHGSRNEFKRSSRIPTIGWTTVTKTRAVSLGGNQGKFALAKLEGKWFEPNGRTASMHIVKPGMVTVQGRTNVEVQAVEFVSMRAARYLGPTTALVDIEEFNGLPAFVAQRYDRRIDQN